MIMIFHFPTGFLELEKYSVRNLSNREIKSRDTLNGDNLRWTLNDHDFPFSNWFPGVREVQCPQSPRDFFYNLTYISTKCKSWLDNISNQDLTIVSSL